MTHGRLDLDLDSRAASLFHNVQEKGGTYNELHHELGETSITKDRLKLKDQRIWGMEKDQRIWGMEKDEKDQRIWGMEKD